METSILFALFEVSPKWQFPNNCSSRLVFEKTSYFWSERDWGFRKKHTPKSQKKINYFPFCLEILTHLWIFIFIRFLDKWNIFTVFREVEWKKYFILVTLEDGNSSKNPKFCRENPVSFSTKKHQCVHECWKYVNTMADSRILTRHLRLPSGGDNRHMCFKRRQRFCRRELCASWAVWGKGKKKLLLVNWILSFGNFFNGII